jgi:hypothetical protein
MGACLLFKVPEQKSRIRFKLVQYCKLERGGEKFAVGKTLKKISLCNFLLQAVGFTKADI